MMPAELRISVDRLNRTALTPEEVTVIAYATLNRLIDAGAMSKFVENVDSVEICKEYSVSSTCQGNSTTVKAAKNRTFARVMYADSSEEIQKFLNLLGSAEVESKTHLEGIGDVQASLNFSTPGKAPMFSVTEIREPEAMEAAEEDPPVRSTASSIIESFGKGAAMLTGSRILSTSDSNDDKEPSIEKLIGMVQKVKTLSKGFNI